MRKSCTNADPATQVTQYPKGCGFLNAVYETSNPEVIALAEGNPTAEQRWLGFAQLLVFPTLIVGLAAGPAIAGIALLVGQR